MSFSNAWKWRVKVKLLSRVRLLATPWTAAHQAPPPLGFSRQEHWRGSPLPSPSPYLSLLPSSVQAATVLPSCSGLWHYHQPIWKSRSFPGSPHDQLVPLCLCSQHSDLCWENEQIGQWHSDAARFSRNNTVVKAKGLVLGLSITTLVTSVK